MSFIQGPPASESKTLVDLFKESASRYPKAIAIETPREQITYKALLKQVNKIARRLNRLGVGQGDRVSVQFETGGADLYRAILGVLFSGAAYVPIDIDDSKSRVEKIISSAEVCVSLNKNGITSIKSIPRKSPSLEADSDAWIIFTSGSSGEPKAVAVTHRSATNLVLSERSMFLQGQEITKGTRVAATLSPAFDASIEEMWLAWSAGAVLVPISRKILTSGPDLAIALRELGIEALSTVPSLARFLVGHDLGPLRLLILGGEAVTADLVAGLSRSGLELWNTYGPTEATIIATATQLHQGGAITIGNPIPGVSIAVLNDSEHLVSVGQIGELAISGIGLGRYLNNEADAKKFRPVESLGWERAYFTGDYVRVTHHGLEFVGRIDEQVKIAGKRIDLAEVELAALTSRGVTASAAVATRTETGEYSIECFVTVSHDFTISGFNDEVRGKLPAGIKPNVQVLDALPMRTSGKVDKGALATLVPSSAEASFGDSFVAQIFAKILGLPEVKETDNFFALGGTSIKVAQVVVELRKKFEAATVADLYKYPTPELLQETLEKRIPASDSIPHVNVPRRSNALRGWLSVILQFLYGSSIAVTALAVSWSFQVSITMSLIALATSVPLLAGPGRALVAGGAIRILTLGIKSGTHPQNGIVHLRIWLAERVGDLFYIVALAGSPWMVVFARITGAKIGKDVVIESLPPVLGNLSIGDRSSIGRDVHLSGWTIENQKLFIGGFEIGSDVRIGNRSFLAEGIKVSAGSEIESGSLVAQDLEPAGVVHGSPAVSTEGFNWPTTNPARGLFWRAAYLVSPSMLGVTHLFQFIPMFLILGVNRETYLGQQVGPQLLFWSLLIGPCSLIMNAATTAVMVRIANRNIKSGTFAINSREGYASWLVEKLLTRSRRISFWLYASVLTPHWARILGARVGKNCEISTFNGQIGLVSIGDECFIADDASLAAREMKSGWVRLGSVTLENRCFIGNSASVRAEVTVKTGVLAGVASTAPFGNQEGSSFLGQPPIEFPRPLSEGDERQTYSPSVGLKMKRFGVELFRLSTAAFSLSLVGLIFLIAGPNPPIGVEAFDWLVTFGGLYVGASYLAVAITAAVKWLLVGRVKVSKHNLWTSFVWRNELVWNFVESLAIPWVGSATIDTPIFNHFFRLLGAKIGRNVSIATWFLDDPDLINIGSNATIMKSADLQTHLFQDRVMQLDRVTLESDATLGSGSFQLPGSSVGKSSQIAAGSLVPRDETVPDYSKCRGNPIGFM